MKVICDFCRSPDVHWEYPCRDHTATEHVQAEADGKTIFDAPVTAIQTGAWWACNVCHALIEGNDRDKLAKRCAKRFVKRFPIMDRSRGELAIHMRRVQGDFFRNRTGPAEYHATPSKVR